MPNGKSNFLEGPVFVRRDVFTAFWRLNLEHVVGGTADLSWNCKRLINPTYSSASFLGLWAFAVATLKRLVFSKKWSGFEPFNFDP